jgi:SMI1-KNR4 cell-wall
MLRSFKSLCDVVAPPIAPLEAGAKEDWKKVESSLSLELPDDYKNLVTSYGSGCWKQFLWILNPFSTNRNLNLIEQATCQLTAEREIRASCPEDVPFALYPESAGLFPWAITDNGDRLYWLTEGDPSDWPIIVYESRGPRFDRHKLSCCDFL